MCLDLNPSDTACLDQEIVNLGGTRLSLHNSGGVCDNNLLLTRAKTLLREGRVVWLRAEVRAEHTVNAKWLSQCCRMARRAGVPRALRLHLQRPWETPPLAALKRLSYVCMRKVKQDAHTDTVWYDVVSDAVDLDKLDPVGILE